MFAPSNIHATAIVESGARLGANTQVWHWVHIRPGAVIGARCVLGQNVYIANRVKLGDNVHVQNNVSIFDNVTLHNDVFCGPSVVFTNVKNPRARYPRPPADYLPTQVLQGATLGANATIVCGITIGCHAMIGAGSVVVGDVPAYALVVGVPAHQMGWVSKRGERLELPLQGAASARCPLGGEPYVLNGNTVSCVD